MENPNESLKSHILITRNREAEQRERERENGLFVREIGAFNFVRAQRARVRVRSCGGSLALRNYFIVRRLTLFFFLTPRSRLCCIVSKFYVEIEYLTNTYKHVRME